ncbi:Bug family tripartite tricarboxylate transporter substrate binding protein [Diaphorobacter aerolatus]|uniref:Tripartite tricarboxylate transporter substrate binding protein n=1 Tax=Diaphorobacter aerolatus TaxID=1288495 RepID=A0A7H0GKS8_9BURK|nr:tripartite tricarboxylate transporter substrate binding protein [Diaphorobacter aerolatus]QNP48894.1 tripartite tricarboxylate transporter substrate binding protein [Diaphorobacter aerolatus]
MNITRRTLAHAVAIAAMTGASLATAAGYPEKPVTIMVGFSAGGPTDVVARVLAEKLSQKFGQSFIIDNKAGASGAVAANLVKKAAPDGYTLMIGSSSTLSIIPFVQKGVQYDSLKDFTPIALVASYPYYLTVPPNSRFKTYDELVAFARQKDNQLTYASAGNGAVNHLAGEWFRNETGINALHVPYKGDSAAITDLVAGRVDFAFLAGVVAIPQVQAGKLRILASASSEADKGLKDTLVIGQQKLPGFAAEPWNGLMGPAGLPADVVSKLNTAVNEIMASPEVKSKLLTLDQYPFTSTPAQFKDYIQKQSTHWANVIRKSNIVLE